VRIFCSRGTPPREIPKVPLRQPTLSLSSAATERFMTSHSALLEIGVEARCRNAPANTARKKRLQLSEKRLQLSASTQVSGDTRLGFRVSGFREIEAKSERDRHALSRCPCEYCIYIYWQRGRTCMAVMLERMARSSSCVPCIRCRRITCRVHGVRGIYI